MSDKAKESILRQELGDKKYFQKVERENKFYDTYKAGKRDPKTGSMYYNIDFKDPRLKTIKQKTIDGFICDSCDNCIGLSRTTFMIQCSNCKTLYKINRDKLTDNFEYEVVRNG